MTRRPNDKAAVMNRTHGHAQEARATRDSVRWIDKVSSQGRCAVISVIFQFGAFWNRLNSLITTWLMAHTVAAFRFGGWPTAPIKIHAAILLWGWFIM